MSTRVEAARRYRMRPAPRARGRAGGRRASRVSWNKLGRVVLVLVLIGILFGYIGPTINFLDAWRDAKTEKANLVELRQEHKRLKERIAIVGKADAAERAARKTGMVAPGERPYVIKGLNR